MPSEAVQSSFGEYFNSPTYSICSILILGDEGRAWNGSADALLRMDKEELGLGSRGGHSGIPVHFSGASRAVCHSESLAGVDSSPGFRALPRVGLPLPCQTFPACRNGGRETLGVSHSHSFKPTSEQMNYGLSVHLG